MSVLYILCLWWLKLSSQWKSTHWVQGFVTSCFCLVFDSSTITRSDTCSATILNCDTKLTCLTTVWTTTVFSHFLEPKQSQVRISCCTDKDRYYTESEHCALTQTDRAMGYKEMECSQRCVLCGAVWCSVFCCVCVVCVVCVVCYVVSCVCFVFCVLCMCCICVLYVLCVLCVVCVCSVCCLCVVCVVCVCCVCVVCVLCVCCVCCVWCCVCVVLCCVCRVV